MFNCGNVKELLGEVRYGETKGQALNATARHAGYKSFEFRVMAGETDEKFSLDDVREYQRLINCKYVPEQAAAIMAMDSCLLESYNGIFSEKNVIEVGTGSISNGKVIKIFPPSQQFSLAENDYVWAYLVYMEEFSYPGYLEIDHKCTSEQYVLVQNMPAWLKSKGVLSKTESEQKLHEMLARV